MSRARVLAALAAFALGLLAALGAAPALAHDSRPLSVGVSQQGPDLYRVSVRIPPTLTADNIPAIVWPEGCEAQQSSAAGQSGLTALLSCAGGLEGRRFAVDYPLYNPSITTLFRVEDGQGVRTAVLPPDQLDWTVPERPGWAQVMRDYFALGFKHIWEGPDHLMFVAGLMLLAGRPWRIVKAVTGFTLAHSITLSLATLGLVRVPIPVVEAMIALSIVFLAAELARGGDSFSRRHPAVLSFVFGLLHGFGFASALSEIGLPTGELAAGLAAFNLGVEGGQLAFVAAAGAAILAWRVARRAVPAGALARAPQVSFGLVGAYILGVPAAVWFFERAAASL